MTNNQNLHKAEPRNGWKTNGSYRHKHLCIAIYPSHIKREYKAKTPRNRWQPMTQTSYEEKHPQHTTQIGWKYVIHSVRHWAKRTQPALAEDKKFCTWWTCVACSKWHVSWAFLTAPINRRPVGPWLKFWMIENFLVCMWILCCACVACSLMGQMKFFSVTLCFVTDYWA